MQKVKKMEVNMAAKGAGEEIGGKSTKTRSARMGFALARHDLYSFPFRASNKFSKRKKQWRFGTSAGG